MDSLLLSLTLCALGASQDLPSGCELSPREQVWLADVQALTDPQMQGRLPGSKGMERAMAFVEGRFSAIAVKPAFPLIGGARAHQYRQEVPLGQQRWASRQSLTLGTRGLEPGLDFETTGHGGSGSVQAQVTFVGYCAGNEAAAFAALPADADLRGKICLVLRYEPLTARGGSRWVERGWSPAARFQTKFELLAGKGAAAILLVDPPGVVARRVGELLRASDGVSEVTQIPVLHITEAAVSQALQAIDLDLLALRQRADEQPLTVDLPLRAELACRVESQAQSAVNLGAILPGAGQLAEELVVLAAHLDHIGMGESYSRDKESAGLILHPGADDNAAGVASLLALATDLRAWREGLAPEASARSVLFLATSAEESGLFGSRWYVRRPVRPLEQHDLMLNIGMIGRIEDSGLLLAGIGSGDGLRELVEPLAGASPLAVRLEDGVPPSSDHWEFYRAEVPALYLVAQTLHEDYNTPRDTVDKLRPGRALQATSFLGEVVKVAAVRPGRFTWRRTGTLPIGIAATEPALTPRVKLRVRFGVVPASDQSGVDGVLIEDVPVNLPALAAGVQAGDILTSWNGKPIHGLEDWIPLLEAHEPGDLVRFSLLRNGQQVDLSATLVALNR